MTEENGAFVAATLGGAYEKRGEWKGQPKCESNMDTDNNAFGIYLGSGNGNANTGACFTKCSYAADNGLLETLK